MIGSALHTIEIAETLLRTSKFRQSLEALGEIDINAISPDELALYYLVWVEANLSLANYSIEIQLRYILEHYRTTDDIEKLARAKFLNGWYLISLGKFFDAKEPLLESLIGFKRVNNTAWQGRVLSRLSFISYHIGEFESAVGYLRTCAGIYRQNNDVKNELLISLNLAQLNTSLGRLSDAMKIYDENRPNIGIVNAKNAVQFFLMDAFARALKGDFSIALQTIDRAREYFSDLTREQAVYFEYLGWIHNLESDFEAAQRTLRQGLDISLKIAPESALVSQTKRLMADAHVGLAEHIPARAYAEQALAVARKLNEWVEIAACYRIFARVTAFAGDAGLTKDWFRQATELFSMIGSRYELAVTRYQAAMSGFYLHNERQALLYLAREYFESENVAHYVARISRELAETPLPRSRPMQIRDAAPIIICRDPSMTHLVDLARHIAPSNMSVLLTGPTGCGKDLFARFIHYHSGRKGRFVSVNAAAIPDNMVESELFGYRKGAYTGAANTTSGWIEEADGGTFYLNEIADSSPELQAKLLDVIENRRVCRLGERQEREIDCRIIAATNHDLDKLIDRGRFRLDLFHRLNEIPIHLPGLAERGRDLEYLLDHFLKSTGVEIATRADRAAFDRLSSIFATRPWHGNVRELEIEVKRLTLLSRHDITRMVELVATHRPSKKEETRAVLEQTGWNRREAARLLGISESTVRHRIKTYNLARENL